MQTLRTSLKARISATTAVLVIIAIGLATGTALMMARQASEQDALRIAENVARASAELVDNKLDNAMEIARANAQAMEALQSSGVTDRDVYNALQRRLLAGHPSLLGVWTAWEPDALDGDDAAHANSEGHDASGRFVPYWYRSGGEIARDVLIDYDVPGAGDYYLLARDSGRETVLDPYVYPIDGEDVLLTSLVVPVRRGTRWSVWAGSTSACTICRAN